MPTENGYGHEAGLEGPGEKPVIGRLERRILFSSQLMRLVLGLSAKKMIMQELTLQPCRRDVKPLYGGVQLTFTDWADMVVGWDDSPRITMF